MSKGVQALTPRERETLRLLARGHDIKSIASHLGLSVHTVNDRLREARRKLGVSSSRQAARVLAEAERDDPDLSASPNSSAHKETGMAGVSRRANEREPSDQPAPACFPLAWLGAGGLILSLIVAIGLSLVLLDQPAPPRLAPAAARTAASDVTDTQPARDWIALLDAQRWRDSWSDAGTLFRTQVSQAAWVEQIQAVRQPLGAASSRVLQSATRTASLPGAPDGEYLLIQFLTNFQRKPDAIETVVLAREGRVWKVDGYFIK